MRRHSDTKHWLRDIALGAVGMAGIAVLAAASDGFDRLVALIPSGLGPVGVVWLALPFAVAWFAWRRLGEARRAIRERDQFMEAVAHRLRTPLSSVVGYSLLLRDEPEAARPEDLWWMVDEVAVRSVEAADLLDDMLVAAHLEHGGLELLLAPVDLSDETEWVLRNYLDDVSVEVDYRGPRRWALADPLRVRQILRILLGNARSHGGDKLRFTIDTTGPLMKATIADNGAGLPIGREDEVFDAFVTQAAHDDARFPIGLGLAVASELAVRMGGSLTYRRERSWSCFDLVVPPADVPAMSFEAAPHLELVDQPPERAAS